MSSREAHDLLASAPDVVQEVVQRAAAEFAQGHGLRSPCRVGCIAYLVNGPHGWQRLCAVNNCRLEAVAVDLV